jgi:uncharacterized membrane protein
MLALLAVAGCGTQNSPQGGTIARDEEFSISVSTPYTIKQGADQVVKVVLNRGAYFKRDVQLKIKAEGIVVNPTGILVKGSDKPEVEVQISVARDAALGSYRVAVQGTPETGEPTSTEFIVNVIPQ